MNRQVPGDFCSPRYASLGTDVVLVGHFQSWRPSSANRRGQHPERHNRPSGPEDRPEPVGADETAVGEFLESLLQPRVHRNLKEPGGTPDPDEQRDARSGDEVTESCRRPRRQPERSDSFGNHERSDDPAGAQHVLSFVAAKGMPVDSK